MDNLEFPASILKRKPYLTPYFLENGPSVYRTAHAKNGERLILDDQERPLASQHNPGVEASRSIPADFKKRIKNRIVLVFGIGNPLLLPGIIHLLEENQICIVIDSRFELGRYLCNHSAEMAEFLERPGCHLFCGEAMVDPLLVYLDSIPSSKMKGIEFLPHQASIRTDREFYRFIEERIRTILKARVSDLLTRFEFESTWIRNILINSGYFHTETSDSMNLLRYENRLSGVPGLLIAAGPSLRDSLDVIRKLKNRAFLLACDTATKVLLRNGIVPDAIITLDAQKNSLFHFLGESIRDSLLFADIVSHPSLIRAVDPKRLIFSTTARLLTSYDGTVRRETTAGTEFIEQFHGPVGSLQSGGSVATSGFDLLRFLGVSEILLVGQDLAYTGREIHSTGTHHNERWLTQISRTKSLEWINEAVIRKRETFMVPSLDGRTVVTDFVLDLYRRWFEESIKACAITTRNLTARGAKIEGAIRVENPEAFAESLPERVELKNLFSPAARESYHLDEAAHRFIEDLSSLNRDNLDDLDRFFERYPWIKPLVRRAETYLVRNRQNMESDAAQELYRQNCKREFYKLERALMPYRNG